MPRSGQIIPVYKHPHEEVYINDNSQYTDETADNMGLTFLNVFASSKGVDRQLKYFNNFSKWVTEYGLPNYRKYGQAGYNAYVALSTGLANSYSMRVTADDATFANLVLVMYYKAENGKFKVKFKTFTKENLRNIDDLDAYLTSLEITQPDEEGYKALPVCKFWSRGRGTYGNDYRIRISHDKNSDKDNGYKNYLFELLSTSEGFSTLESYSGSFYIDAIDPNSNLTMYMNDIIDDENGKGSSRFNAEVMYDNIEKIFEVYKDVYEANGYVPPQIEEVAKLPATSLPSTTTRFILTDAVDMKEAKSVWKYDGDLGTYTQDDHTTMLEVDSDPLIKPEGFQSETHKYWINSANNHVFTFDSTKEVTDPKNSFVKLENDAEVKDNFAGIVSPQEDHIYKITSTDQPEKPNGYYIYKGSEYTKIEAYEDTKDAPVSTGFANVKYVYKITSTYKVLEGSSLSTVSDVKEVATLPDTEIYEEGVVYKLTEADGLKPMGSYWIYDDEASDYIEWEEEDTTNPEPLLLTMETFDIFGYNRFTGEDDKFFEYDGGKEAIEIMNIEGVGMDSGSDGALGDDVDEASREEALEAAYLKAFGGEYDKAILSKRRAPVTMILDANYSYNVKTAIVSLTLNRTDCVCHLDTGLIQNVDDLITYGTRMNTFADWHVSKDPGMFKTVDSVTGKIIPVTMTLWLAQKYPSHFNTYGNHTPMAGETYGTLSGYEKNSIKPVIDADDSDIKEELYDKYHMNYIEALDESTFIRGTQSTSQEISSDLSEENNVLVLLEVKRKIERLAAANRYNWADADEVRLFKESCEAVFSTYVGTKCKELTVDVDYTDWEKLRYIVHVYIGITFRTFQKRAIIEIDVNKRV